MKKYKYVRVCCRCGTPVRKERHKGMDYPYYCPCCDENMYTVETELVKAVKNER